jgi:hypothetical protein
MTCTLPPLSELFLTNNNTPSRSSVLDIANLLSPTTITTTTTSTTNITTTTTTGNTVKAAYNNHHDRNNLKAKRKRASPNQLVVLNRIFSQTYFPSTEIRIELGKQLGMSPRTVQIWFQNKRQALRSRGRHAPESPTYYLPPISPPRSPPTDLRYHHQAQDNFSLPPLRLIPPQQHQHQQQYSSPPSMSFPSPNSIDHLPYRDY